MKSFFSSALIFLGLFSISIAMFLLWQRHNPKRLQFEVDNLPQVTANYETSGVPIALEIKNLGISLPIYTAKKLDSGWETTTKGASFLESSPSPGEPGNSILYGHNWSNLLGGLVKVSPGEEIKIAFADGQTKNFRVKYTQVVTPDQVSVLAPTDDSRITLYTCTGFLDRKRFVVTALLSS